ncbi:hypothetical protein L3Q82_015151 [Scortum barcoo]|uniref:Uncharacterized protein n=1 Tax=Scortum barcoo TaxID=214431 RepID=A0ACB8VTA1_9TELE|nr:hypothetical protein L3Q82_015151 [Scortum barcoo]
MTLLLLLCKWSPVTLAVTSWQPCCRGVGGLMPVARPTLTACTSPKDSTYVGKLNGIKWHYFKGPSYSLRATAMMIRSLDFS